jgi:hypothetical protein
VAGGKSPLVQKRKPSQLALSPPHDSSKPPVLHAKKTRVSAKAERESAEGQERVVPDTSRADTVVAVRVGGASSAGDTAEVGAGLGLLDALGASRGRAVAAVEAVVRATGDRLEVGARVVGDCRVGRVVSTEESQTRGRRARRVRTYAARTSRHR